MNKRVGRLGISLLALSLIGSPVGASELQRAQPDHVVQSPDAQTPEGLSPESQVPDGLSSDIRVGQGVVCDTQDQVERVAALVGRAGDADSVIKIVNEEAKNPVACAVIQAAFVQGTEVTKVTSEKGPLRVVEITILAIPLNGSWHLVSPVKQYTAFPVQGVEV